MWVVEKKNNFLEVNIGLPFEIAVHEEVTLAISEQHNEFDYTVGLYKNL